MNICAASSTQQLLIYVFIPFCLNYKGSVRPSSLYISLSRRIWILLNWNSGSATLPPRTSSQPLQGSLSEPWSLHVCPVWVQSGCQGFVQQSEDVYLLAEEGGTMV